MKLITIKTGVISENAYLYFDESSREGIVIDPGDDGSRIIETIKDAGAVVKAVLLTHGHFDHIGAAIEVAEYAKAPIYAHKDEAEILGNYKYNSFPGLRKKFEIKDYIGLNDNDILEYKYFSLKVIHTPGHTVGSVCYYDRSGGNLFTGDTLFFESLGRTDFYSGDAERLLDSVGTKLLILPAETRVYPGHMQNTSIAHEKMHNPFLAGI